MGTVIAREVKETSQESHANLIPMSVSLTAEQ